MFYEAATAPRFDKVDCDLSDVLGSPGVAEPVPLARALEAESGLLWSWEDAGDELFLATRSEGVGAFGPEGPDVLLADVGARLESALLPREEPSRIVLETRSPSGVHQLHQQFLAGRRVMGGAYRLHAGENGQLAVTGAPIGDLSARDPGPMEEHPIEAVVEAAFDAVGVAPGPDADVEPVLFPLEGGAVWAYLVSCVIREPELVDLRVFVRADTLGLLLSRDVSESALQGRASVYVDNPTRSPDLVDVDILDLADNCAGRLRGALLDVKPRRGEPWVSTALDWRAPDTVVGFDQPNAYHHLTSAFRWFASIIGDDLFGRPPFTPLTVVTGDRAARDSVGRFVSKTSEIVFGDNQRSGARSADICTHEFTHAVVWGARQINELARMEARGLNEGFADYCQASQLDDPRFGDYVAPRWARDCSRPELRFPADPAAQTRPYPIGEAWAAVLWDLRTVMGTPDADKLAVETIFWLEETSTVQAAKLALLASDRRLFPAGDGSGSGLHEDAIVDAFDRRLP